MKQRHWGLIISYVYTLLNVITGVFLTAYILRCLGDVEFGIYQTVSSFTAYLVLVQFGMSTIMARNVSLARATDNFDYVKKCFFTTFCITVFLGLIMAVFATIFYNCSETIYLRTLDNIQIIHFKRMLIFLSGYTIISYVTQSFDGLILGMENYIYSKIVGIFRIFLRTSLIIAVLFFSDNALYIVIVDFCLSIIILLCTIYYSINLYGIEFSFKYWNMELFRSLLPLCLGFFIQTIINQANGNIDKFFISILLDMRSVSVYSVAQYIFIVFSSIMTIPVTMYMPEIAKYIASGKKEEEITEILLAPCRLTAFIGSFILGGFVAVGEMFIYLLYGVDKVLAWNYVIIIMVPAFINMTTAVIVNVLDVINKRMTRSCLLLVNTIINIGLTWVLIGKIGILGAVIATAVAMVFGEIIGMGYYYSRFIDINVWRLYKTSYKGIIPCALVATLLCYFLATYVQQTLFNFILLGGLYVLGNLSLTYVVGLTDLEKQQIVCFINKLKAAL